METKKIITIGVILFSLVLIGKIILVFMDVVAANKILNAPDPEYTQQSYQWLSDEYRALLKKTVSLCWMFVAFSAVVIGYCFYRLRK